MEPTLWMRGARAAATPAVLKSAQHKWRCLLRCICRFLALLGPREMSDLSPQSGPKRTLIRSLSDLTNEAGTANPLLRSG